MRGRTFDQNGERGVDTRHQQAIGKWIFTLLPEARSLLLFNRQYLPRNEQ